MHDVEHGKDKGHEAAVAAQYRERPAMVIDVGVRIPKALAEMVWKESLKGWKGSRVRAGRDHTILLPIREPQVKLGSI
jgi:hypothetical protein